MRGPIGNAYPEEILRGSRGKIQSLSGPGRDRCPRFSIEKGEFQGSTQARPHCPQPRSAPVGWLSIVADIKAHGRPESHPQNHH